VRSLIERLSRQLVLRRRLPADFGGRPFFASPGAALGYWRPRIEKLDPVLLRVAYEHIRAGDVVWDVGANVGLFTFAAAHRVGMGGGVLAIEADTWLVELLRRSCRLPENAAIHVDVLPVAVAGTVGVGRFNVANLGRATSYLDGAYCSSQTRGIRETQFVPTVTLDWLLDYFPPPTFVKIDVEGAEHMVLAGAERILSRHRPVILCEVSENNTRVVSERLRPYGYRFFDAEASAPDRTPLAKPAWNTLAYPPGYEPSVITEAKSEEAR